MKRIQIGGASLGNLLLRFVQGLIIGVGGILPGVSGGVLCIVFGLYQPVMEVFAAPIRNLKKHYRIKKVKVRGLENVRNECCNNTWSRIFKH